MKSNPGIAGNAMPDGEGVFLCDEAEAEFFVKMNNTGGPVDVWAVDGVDADDLEVSEYGPYLLPYAIPPSRLTLVRESVEEGEDWLG
jgi:hypothetical protein